MQDGAYGTVEVPAAPKKKGSLKRLVASAAAVSLALGFAAVTAVDHGLMSFSSEPYVQIKLSGTSFCLGVLDRKNADSKSKLIIYQCDSKMKGQAFQMVPVGGGYNIKYDTKNGGSSVDRTLCVNNPSKGGTLQLYQCKSGDPNSLWYYKNGKLVSDKDDACMATAVPPGQSSLSNSDYVDATWCGNEYTKWNVLDGPTPRPTPRPRPTKRPTPHPTPRPTPRPTARPQSSFSPGCNDLCYYDSDCRTSCSKCLSAGDGSSRKTCQKPQTPGQCNSWCYSNRDCTILGGPNPCSACMPYGDGVRSWCQQYCWRDSDCDTRYARCGRDNYCVEK